MKNCVLNLRIPALTGSAQLFFIPLNITLGGHPSFLKKDVYLSKLYYISRGLKIPPRLLRSNIVACTVNQTEAHIFPVAA
jgi:hypothetical protein